MILHKKNFISIEKKFGFNTISYRYNSESVIDFIFQDTTKKLYEIVLYNEEHDTDKLLSNSFLSYSQIQRLKKMIY